MKPSCGTYSHNSRNNETIIGLLRIGAEFFNGYFFGGHLSSVSKLLEKSQPVAGQRHSRGRVLDAIDRVLGDRCQNRTQKEGGIESIRARPT